MSRRTKTIINPFGPPLSRLCVLFRWSVNEKWLQEFSFAANYGLELACASLSHEKPAAASSDSYVTANTRKAVENISISWSLCGRRVDEESWCKRRNKSSESADIVIISVEVCNNRILSSLSQQITDKSRKKVVEVALRKWKVWRALKLAKIKVSSWIWMRPWKLLWQQWGGGKKSMRPPATIIIIRHVL